MPEEGKKKNKDINSEVIREEDLLALNSIPVNIVGVRIKYMSLITTLGFNSHTNHCWRGGV